MALSAAAEKGAVRLLAEVELHDASLCLAYLLPPDADPSLKSEAEKVSLGRAPDPGGVRVFTARELRKAIKQNPELTRECPELELPEQVVVRRVGWRLEAEAVRRTLARSALAGKFDFSQMPIMLPADFTTAVPHPQLEATAVTSSPDRLRLLATLRCRERTACSSFLAEIVFGDPLSGVIARRSKPASEKLGAISLKQAMPQAISSSSPPVLVRPGQLALLTIEGDGFKITQPVLPLKRARLGELVRVSDPRSHRSWVAQVEGSGQLRTPGMTVHEVTR